MPSFPSMKARELRRILEREPLRYAPRPGASKSGSHTHLDSANGYPALLFSFHDRQTLPPGLVRKVLVKDVGLSEEEALRLV